ncbi:MAG: hypothetical protein IJ813_03420 [Bacteroidales bacterium]|nr:hypothetical protein [Bacteroidales bacterium]
MQSPEVFVSEGEEFSLPFSLAVGSGAGPATKMTQAITQASADEASFRGIKEIYAIPFRKAGTVIGTDQRIGPNLELPQLGIPATFGESANNGDFTGLVRSNNSHLYKNVYMRRGTASMLVYGQAVDETVSVTPDSVAFKRRNGVLRSHNLQKADYPAAINFTLEPFVTSDNEASFNGVIGGLLTYLNSIAAATVSQTGYRRNSAYQTTWTYLWSQPSQYSNYADLKNAFDFFTADGVGFSAGTSGINQMLTTLYNRMYSMANDDSAGGDDYRLTYYTRANTTNTTYRRYYYYVYQLARQIRSLINNSTYVTLSGSGSSVTVTLKDDYASFPDKFGVPAGSVAIQWNGTQFVQQTPATGSALAPVSSYCYPPSLWYMTNSTLRTSDDADITEEYKSANTTWDSIFSQYTYSSTVIPGAESVALKEPLQYGVAMLEVNLNNAVSPGGTQFLLDSKATSIDVRNSNYPLTGIIIGEQKNQEFDFKPLLEGLSSYVYDCEVYDGSTPKAYIAGASAGLTFKPIHTLVVQTEDADDVHIALEFQNNSGADFYGVNSNRIAAGSKFYLIATLKYSEAVNSTGEDLPAVFVHDHTTKVTFSVNSLAKAYNTIPELRDPQLEIGVVTEMEWIQVTPSEVPMY